MPARVRLGKPFSTFERMVAWRYLRARRKEAFISVIAGFSFVGIMLGVATLIIVMAVMNGFRTELISRILGINGHMIVQPIDGPLTDYADVAEQVAAVPGVKSWRFRWSRARCSRPARRHADRRAGARRPRRGSDQAQDGLRQHQARAIWSAMPPARACHRHAHGRPARSVASATRMTLIRRAAT